MDELGVRGFLADDPVYMMGPDDTSVRFALLLPPLNGADATQWMNSSAPLNQRRMSGYGLVIPRTTTSSASQYISPWGGTDVLAGWLCPLADPQSYAIEYQVSFCTSPGRGGRNVGIFFGMTDDRSIQDHIDAGTTFWQATLQWNGSIYLRRYAGGEAVEREHLDAGDAPQLGSWYRFRVIVDDISVRVQRVSFDGVVLGDLTVPGEAHGSYLALFKNETGTDGERYLFTSGHRQLLVQSPYQGQELDPLNPDGSYPWEIGEGEDVPGVARNDSVVGRGVLVDELGEPLFMTDEDGLA